MIFTALLAIPILNFQSGQITETKLFKVQKGKVSPGSITISPDLAHFAYGTTDHKVIIDGKSFGPYNLIGPVLYSGDSKNFAFLANLRTGEPSKIIWNGVEKLTNYQVSNLFRAGETGGLCWSELNKEFTRLIHPSGTTDWIEKIEKLYFSDDGTSFALRASEKIPVVPDAQTDTNAPPTRDIIIRQDGTKINRDRVVQIFPAPNGLGYATLSSDNEVSYRNRSYRFKGEFYAKPVFSPDGKVFAFRNSYTGVAPSGQNIQFYQYSVGGLTVPYLQIQTGLTFAPDGKKWVMCGLNGKSPFIYVSDSGLVPYDEFPGLNGAPPEPYKVAQFANGKIVLLFQGRSDKPILFVEGKGLFPLGEFVGLPDTLSISPDGQNLVIGGSDMRESRAFIVNLVNPGSAKELLKPGYDLQNLGKGTFVWKSNNEVHFMILRKSELIRVSAKI
ncbi:MAG: hypothetical protein WCI55_05660 [Armatimonadota bacterium]